MTFHLDAEWARPGSTSNAPPVAPAPGPFSQPTPPAPTPDQYAPQHDIWQPQFGSPPGQYSPHPGFGQQPTQYDQPGANGPLGRVRRRRKPILIGAAVLAAIVAVVLILRLWTPGFLMTKQLDVNKAQAGVRHILTDPTIAYGAKNVSDVKCNNGQDPVVKKAGTFNCDATIGGTKRQVTVTFVEDNGRYQVSRPN